MKVEEKLAKNVKTSGGASKVSMRLDEDSMGFFLKTFSDSIYSNKIGSVVREITSNCFDSHIEADVKTPVRIEIANSDAFGTASDVINFTDYGVGLSPDRIANIYSVYFKSTKRGDNKEIGGFGIGAKSPLSYCDTFSVTTRFDGTEYHYIIYRGEKAPVIELVDENPTKLHNGTTVSIPIKDYADLSSFKDEIKKQLRFFDNIDYFNCNVDNDYQIIKGDHIIYRVQSGQPDVVRQAMFACLGRVAYPLDVELLYNQGALPNYYSLETPIALYFDIGDLSVTINREQLEYTKKSVATIKEKFAAAQKEIREKQEEGIEAANIFEYMLSLDNDKTEVILGGLKIKIKGLGTALDKVYPKLGDVRLDKSFNFIPIDIPKIIEGGRLKTSEVEGQYSSVVSKLLMLDAKAKGNNKTMVGQYGQPLRYDLDNIQFVRMSTTPSKRPLLYLQDQFKDKEMYVTKMSDNALAPKEHKGSIDRMFSEYPKEYKNATECFTEFFVPLFLEELMAISVKYEDYEPTDDWVKEYTERLKTERLNNTYTSKDEITLRICKIKSTSHYEKVSPQFTMDQSNVGDTQKKLSQKKLFVYGQNTDAEMLGSVRAFLDHFKRWIQDTQNSYDYYNYKSDASIVKIAKQNQKYFQNMRNGWTIEEFMVHHKNRARQILALRIINKRRVDIELLKLNKHLLPKKVYAILQDVLSFIGEFSARGDDYTHYNNNLNGYDVTKPTAPLLESNFRVPFEDFLKEVANLQDEKITAFFTIKDRKSKKSRTFEVISRYRELTDWIDTYPLITMLHLNTLPLSEVSISAKGDQLYDPLERGETIQTAVTNNRTTSAKAFSKYIFKTKPSNLNYE